MDHTNAAQDLCLVERILDSRIGQETGEVEYLIRWQGQDAQGKDYEDTWEPESNVLGEELVEEFEKQGRRHHPSRPSSHSNNNQAPFYTSASPINHTDRGPIPSKSRLGEQDMERALHPSRSYPPTPFENVLRPTMWTHPNHAPRVYGPSGFHPRPPIQHPHFSHPRPHPAIANPTGGPTAGYPPTEAMSHKRKAPGINGDSPDFSHLPGYVPNVVLPPDLQRHHMPGIILDGHKRMKEYSTNRSWAASAFVKSRPKNADDIMRHGIRTMKLDLMNEKEYFCSLVEKSALVQDGTLRGDLVAFLRNPKSPGPGHAESLLASEAWLIEIKKQQALGSLFLLIDVPNAITKALFIQEFLLDQLRRDYPGEGLVIKDQPMVLALMAGDLKASGLLAAPGMPDARKESDTSTDAATKTPSLPESTTAPEQDGANQVFCGWKDCSQGRSTVEELAQHVQKDHLRHLSSAISAEMPSPASVLVKDSGMNGSSMETSWRERYERTQEAYRSLHGEVAQMNERIQSHDAQVRSSSALYEASRAASDENIRRLEARLEWELKKWEKYEEQRDRMMGFDGESSPLGGSGAEAFAGHEIQSQDQDTVPSLPERREPVRADMDQAMEVQSQNSIREIQKLLAEARARQVQLEEDNTLLFKQKRELDAECERVEKQYQETTARLLEAETRDRDAAKELMDRDKNLEDSRAMLDSRDQQSRAMVSALQTKIGVMMQQQNRGMDLDPLIVQEPSRAPQSRPLQDEQFLDLGHKEPEGALASDLLPFAPAVVPLATTAIATMDSIQSTSSPLSTMPIELDLQVPSMVDSEPASTQATVMSLAPASALASAPSTPASAAALAPAPAPAPAPELSVTPSNGTSEYLNSGNFIDLLIKHTLPEGDP